MKKLNSTELKKVSGGCQHLEITSKIEFPLLPAECVDNYFALNKDDLSKFHPDILFRDIHISCVRVDMSASEMDSELISMVLVTS